MDTLGEEVPEMDLEIQLSLNRQSQAGYGPSDHASTKGALRCSVTGQHQRRRLPGAAINQPGNPEHSQTNLAGPP